MKVIKWKRDDWNVFFMKKMKSKWPAFIFHLLMIWRFLAQFGKSQTWKFNAGSFFGKLQKWKINAGHSLFIFNEKNILFIFLAFGGKLQKWKKKCWSFIFHFQWKKDSYHFYEFEIVIYFFWRDDACLTGKHLKIAIFLSAQAI